jgi:uncharacterized membrane protein YhaH (DUF805 family)
MNWQDLFISAHGRVGRRDFWIAAAALIISGLVLNLLPVIGPLAALALLYPWTCILVKRLHDTGRSGWLVLVPTVPAALSGVLGLFAALALQSPATMGAAFGMAGLALSASMLAALIGLGFLLWAGLKAGDAASNRFGEPAAPMVAFA